MLYKKCFTILIRKKKEIPASVEVSTFIFMHPGFATGYQWSWNWPKYKNYQSHERILKGVCIKIIRNQKMLKSWGKKDKNETK